MISLQQDFKQGRVSLKVNSLDDLWYLSHIISPNDLVRMKTERKMKIGDGENAKITRKTVTLTLQVELVTLQEGQLRVKGLIREGPEDVPLASYHSFGVGLDDTLTITKQTWPNYLKEKLKDALNNAAESVIFVVFDREQAFFSLLRQSGLEQLSALTHQGQGKNYQSQESAVFSELIAALDQFDSQFKPVGVVLASSSFWKQNIESILPEKLKSKSVFLETSEIAKSTVYHLLSRQEVHALLANQRLQNEESFVQEVLAHLDKEEVAYGLDDVRLAAESGAIRSLGVTEQFLQKTREENTYEAVDEILKKVDGMQGKIQFLSAQDTAKRIDGLGGIVGILRWKMN
ncbi:MAG: pelota family protein [Nanoarchaeota archaeon]|nr:pelota family protein [Nanoarchaeota archaeon]